MKTFKEQLAVVTNKKPEEVYNLLDEVNKRYTKYYGLPTILTQLMEECGELITVSNKMQRDDIPDKSEYEVNFIEELVDVYICITRIISFMELRPDFYNFNSKRYSESQERLNYHYVQSENMELMTISGLLAAHTGMYYRKQISTDAYIPCLGSMMKMIKTISKSKRYGILITKGIYIKTIKSKERMNRVYGYNL